VAAEGIVAVDIDAAGKVGAIVEVNSETDFVAKNDDFVRFAKDLAALVAARKPADVAALSALPLGAGTVETTRTGLIGRIGENMAIRRFARLEARGRLASYVHGGSKIGVLVDVSGGDAELAKDVAMHIAASKPKSLDLRRTVHLLDTSAASRSRRRARRASQRRCSTRSPRAPCRSS
jgi:elongation factor Ts